MAKVIHKTPPGFRRINKDGRIVYAPSKEVLAVHKQFKKQVPVLYYQDPGRDIANHVRKHQHRYFFVTDLKSAFDCVTLEMLKEPLWLNEIDLEWIDPPEYFFHDSGHGSLIQGAPMSPYLFELYCRFCVDTLLRHYCDSREPPLHYSRFVDDILISSPERIGRKLGPKVREIAQVCGFTLNDGKTKRVDVYSNPLTVLGYTIRGKRIDPPDKTMQRLFEEERSDLSLAGIHRWRGRIRNLNK